MSKKSKTPSFIAELPLQVSQEEQKMLLKRFEVGRFFYNACLGEALKRLNRLRQSREFQKAKQEKDKKEKTSCFRALKKRFEFEEYALHSYATRLSHSYLGEHLDSNTSQKLATRAFNAVEKILFGKAQKVRFKGKTQLSSLEGKSNDSGIRFKENSLIWGHLKLAAKIPKNDEVVEYALKKPIKYVRLVKRILNGKIYFYAQLVLKGIPFVKKKHKSRKKGSVGLDLGPSTIATVSKHSAQLKTFCKEIDFKDKQTRQLKRKLERERRANNPHNYKENGMIEKGKKEWVNSKRYLKTKQQIAEIERKLASQRKTLHGEEVNKILKTGNRFCFEKLSYKAWQKIWGKSILRRAPGFFIKRLQRKAESAGFEVCEFSTRSTKLSQRCQCGILKKKPLSLREHRCPCGVYAQRDLYSAYLAQFVDQDYSFHADQAIVAWSSADSLLRTVWEKTYQTASVSLLRNSFGNPNFQRQSRSSAESKNPQSEAKNAVASIPQVDGESLRQLWLFP